MALMHKTEFIEYCKGLSNIFDENNQPVDIESLSSLLDENSVINVIDTPLMVNIVTRKDNTCGTTYWRGTK